MILVTGDVVVDHNIYSGQRLTPDSQATPGMIYTRKPGGAMLTYGMLDALARLRPGKSPEIVFGIANTAESDLASWPAGFQSAAIWEPFPGPVKGKLYWRLARNVGYGRFEKLDYPGSGVAGLDKLHPRLLVIDDGALGIRWKTAADCWPAFLTGADKDSAPEWIILKASRPLGRGDLWRELSEKWKDRLIVIARGDNLRREDVRVRKGLSWESTVNDLIEELETNPSVQPLQLCRHLVITMGGDAALWLDDPGAEQPGACRLVFDRERGEGELDGDPKEGSAFGFLSAVTASIAWTLSNNTAEPLDLSAALSAGLSTTRFLRDYGHGPVDAREPAFPFAEAAAHILNPTSKYAIAEVRCPKGVCSIPGVENNQPQWTILRSSTHSDAFPGPLFGPARRVALIGPSALPSVPCARFGKLLTMDRHEIEALRSVRQLMLSYRSSGRQKQPLSLAVFGAPGSGKSFGLKQIAQAVFGDKNPVLEFNLSQFKGPDDLLGAYHQVRDSVLTGATPVVFWDEFDSKNYYWLQYLLAPMQDGVFQEGQLTHAIGSCVFVFAGGTSRDFAHFGPPDDPPENESAPEIKARVEFVMAKGPNFRSRLAGFLDVLGPNQRQRYEREGAHKGVFWVDDASDVDFPVRRAILLRSLLGLVGERENSPLEIDRGLLTALLEIGHYRNGARSMEKLVGHIRDRGGLPLRRAHLPPDDLLSLYVDSVPRFHQLIRRSHAFLEQAQKLAPLVHEAWRQSLSKEESGNSFDKPYEELDQEGKDGNIAAAMRIPEILALAGFVLEPGAASEEGEHAVSQFLDENLETLAEAEHDGWADQKRMEGWTFDPVRDNARRTHNLLIPYRELPQHQKEKDRNAIRLYPRLAREAGFKIASGARS